MYALHAWVTSLRRQQAITRANVSQIEVDDAHGGILKLNPLADWSEQSDNMRAPSHLVTATSRTLTAEVSVAARGGSR
ncbi:MAG: phosphoadenosine phosphosulfate reductase family protein [Armatimonadota bacterium]